MSASDCFFVNLTELLRTVDAKQEMMASLERIVTYNPPVHTCSTGWTFHGFYSGPTSIAYLFYALSEKFPDLEFKQQSLFDWAGAYLSLGARHEKKAPGPNHCGIANETLAHLALTAKMQQDLNLVRRICSYESSINTKSEEGSNEWLYGRAGYLYILRLCRTFTQGKDDASTNLINATIKKTASRILNSPQPWSWHGKSYLGAAHGTAGIVHQLVRSHAVPAEQLKPIVRDLLNTQLPSGNFPSALESSSSNRLVQFCHGSAGFVLSFAGLDLWSDLGIEEAIRKAKDDVWRRGLLKKGPCLCHGIAGDALALGVGDGDGDIGGRERFLHFLSFMTTEEMERVGWLKDAGKSDGFVGLFTGEAGRAWVWSLAMDKSAWNGRANVCIGFNDI